MSSQPATTIASEVRLLTSERTGRDYRITISLPYAYERPWVAGFPAEHARAQWPVIYLLDANWYFGMVTDITRTMAWCGRTSDAIVVGIGYPEADDPQETWLNTYARRVIDLSPVRDEFIETQAAEFVKRPAPSGDGERFHQFIKHELIPLIENGYRTDPAQRILVGHSYAGLFGAFALLLEPELFATYIIASPSISESERVVFKRAEASSRQRQQPKTRVHLSAGDLEESQENPTVSDIFRFAALLESRHSEGLTIVKQVFADMNHCEVVAPALHAGLLWALRK